MVTTLPGTICCGEVPEWPIGHAWRACVLHKSTGGSNPSLSANLSVWGFSAHRPTRAGTECARRDRFLTQASGRIFRRGLRLSNPAARSGRTGPWDRRRTKTIHFARDFYGFCKPSVRQSRREAWGSAGAILPNRLANRIRWAAGPPAPLHAQTPEARCAVLAARDLATPPLAGDAEQSFIYI